jgi:hypothetical protein
MRRLLLKEEEEEEDSDVAEHLRMFACYEVTSEKLSLQFSKLRNYAKFLHPACGLLFQN